MRIPSFFVLLALSLASAPLPAQTELRVASITYPPYLEEDGATGMTYDLLQSALGPRYRLLVDVLPPARAQAKFEAGEYDLTLLSKDFSQLPGAVQVKMFKARLVFLARATDAPPSWTTLGDLAGRSVGLTSSLAGSTGAIKTKLESAGLTIVNINSLEQGLAMLKADRFDLLFTDAIAGWTAVQRQYPDSDLFAEVSPPFLLYSGGPWFNTRLPRSAQAVLDYRQGFKALVQSGRARALLEKYLGKGRVPAGIFAEEPTP